MNFLDALTQLLLWTALGVLIAIVCLFVFCFLVKLGTYSVLRGRELFEQAQRRRSKDGH